MGSEVINLEVIVWTFVLSGDEKASSDEVVRVSNVYVGAFIFWKRVCWKKFSDNDVSSWNFPDFSTKKFSSP